MRGKPADSPLSNDDEVAVARDADSSMATGGVGTPGLVLAVDTVLTQVAAEVTFKEGPLWYGAVPLVGVSEKLRGF